MLVRGNLEDVPLLEVFQVLAFSKQTGALYVDSGADVGVVLFQDGGVVCGESPSTRKLLEKAARETNPQSRRALRRVQALSCLTELMSMKSGMFRFEKLDAPREELSSVDVTSFYAAGAMSTSDLLLILANAIDKKDGVAGAPKAEPERPRKHPRISPTLIEAELESDQGALSGYLTNLSLGGAFFQGDALPEEDSTLELRFELSGIGSLAAEVHVAWSRPESGTGERGVGLEFASMTEDDRARLESYLSRFQKLATEMDLAV